MTVKAFRITDKKGFHLTFPNGNTISIQFGQGNYCDNRDTPLGSDDCQSDTAEVALWDAEGNWLLPDEVEGWCSPARVLELIAEYSK